MSLATAAQTIGTHYQGPERDFSGVCIDSRHCHRRMMFVALQGARSDGHAFVADAERNGAAAVLVSRAVTSELPQLRHSDPMLAMGKLARAWRGGLAVRVIGVTGSNGKTTVKNLLAAILGKNCLATEGNYNNELGLPLTLMRLSAGHQQAVVEMGAGGPGDIKYLAEIAQPDVGVITNAGPAHLQRFGTVEGVAKAKGELLQALPKDGIAILNFDDPMLPHWQRLAAGRRVVGFGYSSGADIRCHDAVDGVIHLTLPDGQIKCHYPLQGRHNVCNAAAAVAAAWAIGCEAGQITAGLSGVEFVGGRLHRIAGPDEWTLIDDSYNANPASLKAGIEVLCGDGGEPWLILGDMAELGETASSLHFEAGRLARRSGVRRLYSLGPLAERAAEGFGKSSFHFDTLEGLAEQLNRDLKPGVCCLMKGSRSMRMERLLPLLIPALPNGKGC